METDSLKAREIKDLSLAFSKVPGCVRGAAPVNHQPQSVNNVQIVLPPKMGEPSRP